MSVRFILTLLVCSIAVLLFSAAHGTKPYSDVGTAEALVFIFMYVAVGALARVTLRNAGSALLLAICAAGIQGAVGPWVAAYAAREPLTTTPGATPWVIIGTMVAIELALIPALIGVFVAWLAQRRGWIS